MIDRAGAGGPGRGAGGGDRAGDHGGHRPGVLPLVGGVRRRSTTRCTRRSPSTRTTTAAAAAVRAGPPTRCWPRSRRWPRSRGWWRSARPGLDYYRDHAAPDVQRWWFREHIKIAKRTGKALMIHDREAHEDVLRILAEEGPPDQVVFHCFSGDVAMVKQCAEAGLRDVVRGQRDVRQRAAAPRRRRGRPGRISCWPRPTRRSSPRCRTGAGPTSPPWSRTPCAAWPRSRGWTWRTCATRSPPPPGAPSAPGETGSCQRLTTACGCSARPTSGNSPSGWASGRPSGWARTSSSSRGPFGRSPRWPRWSRGRRGARGGTRARLAHAGPAGGRRRPAGGHRDRPGAGRRAAADDRRPRAAARGPGGRGHRGRAAGRRAGPARRRRRCWSRTCPTTWRCRSLLHLLAAAAHAAAGPGHGAGRGGGPDVRRTRIAGVRRAVGEAGLVRGGPVRPGRCRAPCSGRCPTWIPGWSRSPGATRRPTTAAREEVFAVIDAAFRQRRKTLRAALAGWAGSAPEAERLLRAAGIDPGARGESLGVAEFARLAAVQREGPRTI